MTNYEEILGLISALVPAPTVHERDVTWITDSGVVGVARAHDTKVEIFLRGDRLEPVSLVIRELLEHQTWFRSAGLPPIEANRLMLPAAGHFDQVAAFICTELLRNDADLDLVAAFRQTEPIIELAIRRLRISDEAILGLAGELVLMEALCKRAGDDVVGALVDNWHGWQKSLRDFVVGSLGIEVKTTTRQRSLHHVQGVHQVEPSVGKASGPGESSLLLVSIGLAWEEGPFTIPVLVDSILERLRQAGRGSSVDSLLAHLREYGAESGIGYEHMSMAREPQFARSFVLQFVRGYDMSDPGIEVLRSADIEARSHVMIGTVVFEIDLPDRVAGDLNPITGVNEVARLILAAAP
jgi:hypothetical protein